MDFVAPRDSRRTAATRVDVVVVPLLEGNERGKRLRAAREGLSVGGAENRRKESGRAGCLALRPWMATWRWCSFLDDRDRTFSRTIVDANRRWKPDEDWAMARAGKMPTWLSSE